MIYANIIIYYIILTALLCWLLIGSKGGWVLKLAVSGIVLYFSLFLGFFIKKNLGYPVEISVPKCEILWISIEEPKNIILFVKEGGQKSRLIQTPYSEEAHKQAQEAIKALKQGKKIGMGGRGPEGEGQGGGADGKEGGHKANSGESWIGHSESIYYELPPPLLPRKESQE